MNGPLVMEYDPPKTVDQWYFGSKTMRHIHGHKKPNQKCRQLTCFTSKCFFFVWHKCAWISCHCLYRISSLSWVQVPYCVRQSLCIVEQEKPIFCCPFSSYSMIYFSSCWSASMHDSLLEKKKVFLDSQLSCRLGITEISCWLFSLFS
jgi:hypothetical protein